MLGGLVITLDDVNQPTQSSLALPVSLSNKRVVSTSQPQHRIGHLEERIATVLNKLNEQDGIILQCLCRLQRGAMFQGAIKKGKAKKQLTELSVILYGPMTIFDAVGDFLQRCELHLEDPIGCDRNVRYRNPQSLWGLDENEVRMTQDLTSMPTPELETFQNPVDLLADLEYEDELPEADQPTALKTNMYP